ncbi:MAG: DUF2087 domain-containing protein [Pseudomonadota bacterium]
MSNDLPPLDFEQTRSELIKALVDGRLPRLPRHPRRRDGVLALLACELQRRYPYSEVELNDALREGLGKLRADVDHATTRRYLVDCGFLKRDRAGTRYLLNFPKLEATLDEHTRVNAQDVIEAALAHHAEKLRARAARSTSHRT